MYASTWICTKTGELDSLTSKSELQDLKDGRTGRSNSVEYLAI